MITRADTGGGRAVARTSLTVGVLGLAICVVGFVVDPRKAYAAYLVAYMAVLTTVVGALILVMISHASGAKWFVVLRRVTETAATTIPVLILLFVPILFGARDLYPWVPPLDRLPDTLRTTILQKRAYLNVPFFVGRAVVYFAVWAVSAALLRHWSVRQDRESGTRLTRYQRRLSAGGLPAIAVTLTFASFDWMMSLTPAWYSTIYGVYVFAGGFVAALALVGVLATVEYESGRLADPAMHDHLHALGKLLLTFVLFWAYIGFSQILIIWIAGIPIEIGWYAARSRGVWGAVGLVLLVGHFLLPFLVLLSRRVKRQPRAMATVGSWLLVMHYFDVSWLVLPATRGERTSFVWWDLAAVVGVSGLTVAYGAWRLRMQAEVPLGDPYLPTSLGYRSAT